MAEMPFEKIDDYRWRIPRSFRQGMLVPGIIYADDRLLESIRSDKSAEQVANVASLPGIVGYSLAMPDIHWGYGFPIGGVAATDTEAGGVISPGGVGFDINCGVRLVRTNLEAKEISGRVENLVDALFANVPCGVGVGSAGTLNNAEVSKVAKQGARWVVEQGHGVDEDVLRTEEEGCLEGADSSAVSPRAVERARKQLGTLGSGNHFLEVQAVEKVYDSKTADAFGIFEGQVTVMIHCGSRGFGHQVCQDYLQHVGKAMKSHGISVADRQLACVPVSSREGQDYFSAMASAANYAWANRQLIMDLVRGSFEKVFGGSWEKLGMELVYDVAHNIAKFEKHNGKTLCVHRKGATRAFAPGRPELPRAYADVGQPVLIPGDMGTSSYVMAGTERAMKETWGSTCHGAGRVMSRHAAVKASRGKSLTRELRSRNIIVRARGKRTLAEEGSYAYKDVNKVVDVVHNAGISRRVARMKPLGVVKG